MSVEHDVNSCRAYELMMEITQYVYAMQSDQQNNTSTTQYGQGREGRGGFRGRGRGGGLGRGCGQVICYNYGQQGHYARDCTNTTTTCKYCKSYDHFIEECHILQAKMQENRPQMGNQNVQLIGAKNCTPDQKINVITRSGLATDGAQLGGAKQITTEWVRKSTVKSPTFDLQKEKETFLQERRDFCDVVAFGSKTNYKGREIAIISLRSDPFAGDDQQAFNIKPHEENESTGLVKSFLQSCLKFLRDERVLLEMQNYIDKCEQPISMATTNKVVHHIKKYVRTGREM